MCLLSPCPLEGSLRVPAQRQWPSRAGVGGSGVVDDRKKGSLPSGCHKHLCATNLRRETGCPGVARGQEWDRKEAGGDRRKSGRGQLCRESGRPRVEMGRPPYPQPAPGHRGPPVLQPGCCCHLRGEHRVASSRNNDAEGSPAQEGKGQPPVCPRPGKGRCARGHPAPDAPSPSGGTRDYSGDAG